MPLISNLSVGENIALIRQYHDNLPLAKALEEASEVLGKLGMQRLLRLRSPALSDIERFAAKLAMAVMVKSTRLVIDRPFLQASALHHRKELETMLAPLESHIATVELLVYEAEKNRWEERVNG